MTESTAVRCTSCRWRSRRVISMHTDSPCPRCTSAVEVGYFLRRGGEWVRAWRRAWR